MQSPHLAWHFLNQDWTTSSGNLLVKVGEPIIHDGPIVACQSGLHASARAIDALLYAHGPVVTLVECEGDFVVNSDKFVCRKRTALWGYDCTDELWTFARLCALEVLPQWPDAPDVVREFLETGNEDFSAAAWEAARAAAREAARAAWEAGRATARAAAREAARAAAWAAAWAAWEAARAAWAAAAAAREAARAAAWAAAREAARAAALSHCNEILEAARAAALSHCNEILESLLIDGAVARGLVK